MWPVPHDFIDLQISNYRQNESEVVVLYKKGLSLRDIEKRCGYSKTKVRDVLISAQIPLRKLAGETRRAVQGTRAKKNAKPPYGFCYFEGQVVVHPKEYPNLLAIIGRWKAHHSLNSIATWLNVKRVPSPMGKSWSWNSISNIIQRIKTGHLIEKAGHYELR